MRKSRCLCGRPLEYQELHSLFMAQHALASHITFQSCRKGALSLVPQMIKTQQVHELEHELGSDTSDALYRGSCTKAIMDRKKAGCVLWFSLSLSHQYFRYPKNMSP